ncbi:cellulose binding domain-containing protein [Amycolatopsis sp. NPDC004747]
MARAWRPDDEISVDQLLRETGAMPRSLHASAPAARVRDDGTGDGYRERLEQRARDAATAQQRAGKRLRWVSAFCGGVVVLGSLVVIAVTSESPPVRTESLGSDPLAPATRTSGLAGVTAAAPMPTVLQQTSTAASTSAAAKAGQGGGPGSAPGTGTAPGTGSASAPVSSAAPSVTRSSPAAAPPPPPPACSVHYVVTNQWNNGFTASVTVTNTSNRTLSPWTAGWTFSGGQRVTQSWNGDYSQSGSRVTMKAVSYNLTLNPGASVDIGFNGAFDWANPSPGQFTLNGSSCNTR